MISSIDNIEIAYLADWPSSIPGLAALFIEVWEPYYGAAGPGDAVADLSECLNRDTIPIAVIALDENRDILGTAALKPNSLGDDKYPGPWLAALVVAKEHRRKGIGEALVAAIEAQAKRLGFSEIYTSTDAASTTMSRRSWQVIDTVGTLRGSATIFKKAL